MLGSREHFLSIPVSMKSKVEYIWEIHDKINSVYFIIKLFIYPQSFRVGWMLHDWLLDWKYGLINKRKVGDLWILAWTICNPVIPATSNMNLIEI